MVVHLRTDRNDRSCLAYTNSNWFKIAVVVLLFLGAVILYVSDVVEINTVSDRGGKEDTGPIAGALHVEEKKTELDEADEKEHFQQTADDNPASDAAEKTDESKPVPTYTTETPATPVPNTLSEGSTEVSKPDESKPVPTDTAETPATTSAGTVDGETTDRHTYRRRGQPLTDEEQKEMIDKWGSWTLEDTKERPQTDYYKRYPNRDIPRSEFPANAWQIDKEYLGKFLPEALALVDRARNAILEEYGNITQLFEVEHIENLTAADNVQAGSRGRLFRQSLGLGGWTTPKSWEGMKRRLLHAVMTEDSFNFATAGHSAAAGHGNHFQQSYTLQVQWILEAVFARLGVRHSSRNFGQGGLGVIQHAIASAGVFGPDVDMLMWDSGMTENVPAYQDVMARQQILGGTRVPMIWSWAGDVSKFLHLHADVDVGYPGTGAHAIPMADSVEAIEKLPWALRYMSCQGELAGICGENKYIGVCWIDREDFTPPTEQVPAGYGRASWHPGNRVHQLIGRVIAFTILDGLKGALTIWNEAPNYELPDEAWHLTVHNENIRSKVAALKPEEGPCHSGMDQHDLDFTCNVGLKARTEFTPRAYADKTNLRTLMPPDELKYLNEAPKNVYEGPDVFNPSLHPPKGATDVLNIVEAGVEFKSTLNPDYVSDFYEKPTFASPPKMPPGKGFNLGTHAGDGFCNGTVDSFCNRGETNACLLYAHNDGRTGIQMDGYSGWMVYNLPNVIRGYIVIKFESWYPPNIASTEGWTSENNETAGTRSLLRSFSRPSSNISNPTPNRYPSTTMTSSGVRSHRQLKWQPPPFCEDFKFEYAIDGQVTSLNLTEWEQRKRAPARVVETMTLLRDPDYTGGVAKEVELAFRMTGCGRLKVFNVNHVYFA